MKKKNEEVKNELFFYLSYNSNFSHTKTSILAELRYIRGHPFNTYAKFSQKLIFLTP